MIDDGAPERPTRAQRLRDRTARGVGARHAWDLYDVACIVVVAVATVALHPVHGMLSHPYWLDEAWVAVLTKAPILRVVGLRAPAPAGFLILLRFVPGSGLQRARLVVLLFSALATVMAYVIARAVSWPSRFHARVAALAAALLVMMAPAALVRNDLKQYTCDAFCALVVVAVGAWADRDPARSRLWWLALTGVVVLPFSSTSMFVTVAAFTGLLVSAAIDRSWRRVRTIVAIGALAGIGVGGYFAAVVAPTTNAKLQAFWDSFYLSGSPQHVVHVSWDRLVTLQSHLAMPASVFVLFFLCGVAVLVKLRAKALAVMVPFLWVEMVVVGRVRKYPFLDLRTSTFLLMASLVIVAIGAAGLVFALAAAPVARNAIRYGAAGVVGAGLTALFLAGSVGHVHQLAIPDEDVRSPTLYVAAHSGPRDVIVVNDVGNFGFSYYWPRGPVHFHRNDTGQDFGAEAVDAHALYTPARTYAAILGTMREAVVRWKREGPGSRIFIVRTHNTPAELEDWRRSFDVLHLVPQRLHEGGDLVIEIGPLLPSS